ILPVKSFEKDHYIVTATARGIIKKTELMAYSNPRAGGIIALTIDAGDSLIEARLTDGKRDLLLASRDGKSIRFPEDNIRSMGRPARGVRGMNLVADDEVVSLQSVSDNTALALVTVTENGYGKRTDIGEYRVQSRGGKGIITIKTSERNGRVVAIKMVDDESDLMFITNRGKLLRTKVKNIRAIGRNTQGVRMMVLENNEFIVSVAKLAEKDATDGAVQAEEEIEAGVDTTGNPGEEI
ncbi:MAG: DNA gyrase subunit A, partial [Desulfuromusa sp.]|nr:DNA gyrase subunit A [Desulfuromusa sp.]